MHNMCSIYSNGNIQKPAPCRSQTNHQPQDRSTVYSGPRILAARNQNYRSIIWFDTLTGDYFVFVLSQSTCLTDGQTDGQTELDDKIVRCVQSQGKWIYNLAPEKGQIAKLS